MHSSSDVRPFTPSRHWREDWPYDEETVVQARASVTGTAADRAVNSFHASLTAVPDAEVADGTSVHYWGGYTAETSKAADGDGWQILLKSAGEDGIGSVMGATEDLVEALRAGAGDVRLTWHEMAATRADGT
ncbi:hypothetical protein [Brevibacterium atlanticum]|uniref:hypothetical protein n=1 Tax=Brevibacterium atlanticum TaxID=2697563 RepID=UPI0014239D80|nr:hypothetical protein [Brevibacterium atlanticum]